MAPCSAPTVNSHLLPALQLVFCAPNVKFRQMDHWIIELLEHIGKPCTDIRVKESMGIYLVNEITVNTGADQKQ